MTVTDFELEDWCAAVGGLERLADDHWRSSEISPVSYSAIGHAALESIEESSYWFNHRNAVIASVISAFPPPEGVMFDVGGGNGYVSLALKRAGLSPVVVEPGENGVHAARRRELPVIQAAFEDLQIPVESIPSAGLFDVLEHIEDDRGALAGLHNSIMPDGRLYLAVPAFQSLWASEDIEAGHFRRYSKKALVSVVEEAGFQVERVTYFFSVLVLPVFLLRALPHRLGLGLRRDPGDDGAAAHSLPDSAAGRFIERMLDRELRKIELGEGRGFGTSIMLVARRR